MNGFDPTTVPSPSYVVSLDLLEANAQKLASIRERTGAKVLLACKSFAMYSTFPLLRRYLDGVCTSGLHESLLAHEEFGKEVHTYSPAYTEADLLQLIPISHHLAFNSVGQWQKFRHLVGDTTCGLRINPEVSQASVPLYDPCGKGSRLGIRAIDITNDALEGISGFTFHALCEQDSHALENVLDGVEERFGKWLQLPQIKWINFGGGHFITNPGYDIDHLCSLIKRMRDRYDLQVYIEPGSAVALNTGVLVATVLDIVDNDGLIAILDTSATTHMPDTLEMPYEPRITGAKTGSHPDEGHIYRLGGPSCLSGDFVGNHYTFPAPLEIGQKIIFEDMAHYTMVKNNTFNGIPLPAIITHSATEGIKIIKQFGYQDYKMRLS
jgi:carboxynorspermidine decarboxylase